MRRDTWPSGRDARRYNVTATLDSSVSSALDMPMAAAAYADAVQDKLFGETLNGLLA